MKKHAFPIFIILAAAAVWLIFYSQLPSQLPIHWGLNGEADGYASKFSAMAMSLALLIFVYLSLYFLPKIDPKRDNYQKFSRSYLIIIYCLMALFFVINLMIIVSGLGYSVSIKIVMPVILGLLFIILGNYMQQVKPNWFIGIKTPWTLSDEEVWKKTHRFSAKLFFATGIIILLSLLAPSGWRSYLIFPVIIISSLISIASSYYFFKKNKNVTNNL
ncbi:SdpI family protein [Fictibacillus fluitans]|uniref:SdpI family protein n=1 Tax=Fictibacillus fluitans TaxID=3058422 RepID=A0ABT8I1I9_9BACL|nr:SdpI family protein [Fictibacillus sp. NE201]MDN4526851.1 SdpI family protein [Fictibacillus sp. NE201]